VAKIVSMRMYDPVSKEQTHRNFVEIFCFGEKRPYFKRITKEQADMDGTTIRVTQPDKNFEVKIMGSGWSVISKSRFKKYLDKINKEREDKSWPAISLPDPVATVAATEE
jgi:hypothetical protein